MKGRTADRKQNAERKRKKELLAEYLTEILLLIMIWALCFYLWFETHLQQSYY